MATQSLALRALGLIPEPLLKRFQSRQITVLVHFLPVGFEKLGVGQNFPDLLWHFRRDAFDVLSNHFWVNTQTLTKSCV